MQLCSNSGVPILALAVAHASRTMPAACYGRSRGCTTQLRILACSRLKISALRDVHSRALSTAAALSMCIGRLVRAHAGLGRPALAAGHKTNSLETTLRVAAAHAGSVPCCALRHEDGACMVKVHVPPGWETHTCKPVAMGCVVIQSNEHDVAAGAWVLLDIAAAAGSRA